jgi:hypothetical protein
MKHSDIIPENNKSCLGLILILSGALVLGIGLILWIFKVVLVGVIILGVGGLMAIIGLVFVLMADSI